jgi:hypothetical protein
MCESNTVIIAQVHSGRILLNDCPHRDQPLLLGVEFGNVMHWMDVEDFQLLEFNVRHFNLSDFFAQYPGQTHVMLKTPFPSLWFRFPPEEFLELRVLLSGAAAQLNWRDYPQRFQN